MAKKDKHEIDDLDINRIEHEMYEKLRYFPRRQSEPLELYDIKCEYCGTKNDPLGICCIACGAVLSNL